MYNILNIFSMNKNSYDTDNRNNMKNIIGEVSNDKVDMKTTIYNENTAKNLKININVIQIGKSFLLLLDEKLGSGSFGSVYKGKYIGETTNELKQGQYVAIKEIPPLKIDKKGGVSEIAANMIKSECNIALSLINKRHPNIVSFYEVIEQNSKVYIVMELCDSGNFKNFMIALNKRNEQNRRNNIGAKYDHIKEEFIQFYFSQLVQGIQFLRENDIMHRDIKLENILLTNQKSVLKIVDFGLAKQKMSDKDLTGTICGSPQCMAPEIIECKKYSSKSDLWSIGIVLFQLVYNFHPLEDCKNLQQLYKSLKDTNDIQVPPIVSPNNIPINTRISTNCVNLIGQLLKKKSSDRITMKDFFEHEYVLSCHNAYRRKIFENSNIQTVKTKSSKKTKKRNY